MPVDWLPSRRGERVAPRTGTGSRHGRRALIGGGATDTQEPSASAAARALAGGRLTLDSEHIYLGSPAIILPPPDLTGAWSLAEFDPQALTRFTPAELLEILADLSPEVSRAIWDFLRTCNPGWEADALRPGTEEQDPRGQLALDTFLATLHDLYGTIDVVINRLFIAAFLRGAFMAELVLGLDGRTPADLATPDPHSVRFRRAVDPVRGETWELGQWQVAGFIPLNRPTVRYIPVDPFPGAPYGRPLASPAVFTCLFSLGLMHDLRRVIAQQGYPRIDITLDLQQLKEMMPDDAVDDPAKFAAWAQALDDQVRAAYAHLRPDDAYIHSDAVAVNRPVGTVDASSLGAVDGIITALERMSARALKSMPLMMGSMEGASEATANRQYEAYSQGVRTIQHTCETLLERLLTLALRAQGIPSTVRWRFAENRAAELLRDAQTEALKINNAMQKYAFGWISQEEAANEVTDHAPDQPSPRFIPAGGAGGMVTTDAANTAMDQQPDPGANRYRLQDQRPRLVRVVEE